MELCVLQAFLANAVFQTSQGYVVRPSLKERKKMRRKKEKKSLVVKFISLKLSLIAAYLITP